MFNFEDHIIEDVDGIAENISLRTSMKDYSVTSFEHYINSIDYMLPKKSIYWRFEFKTNMYRNRLRHYVKSWLYLTLNGTIVIEFTIGDWRGYTKIMTIYTLTHIQNNFLNIDTQLKLDEYLSTFKH